MKKLAGVTALAIALSLAFPAVSSATYATNNPSVQAGIQGAGPLGAFRAAVGTGIVTRIIQIMVQYLLV